MTDHNYGALTMRLTLSTTLPLVLISMLLTIGCSKSQSLTAVSNNQNLAANQQTAPSSLAQNASSPVSASTTPSSRGRVDACSLLTAEEVKAVQGEAFKETKPSGSAENGLVISQCFFSLPTFANSVSLAVTEKGDGAGAHDPREFWEKTFASSERYRENEREKRKEKNAPKNREEEEEGSSAQKIVGVGDEAFWQGNRVGGALYVLKHDSYIRVSVGGKGDQKTKIEKSTALARLALKRLS